MPFFIYRELREHSPGGGGRNYSTMKIGVVGCGAVGSYYGAQLGRTDAEVWFLLRSDYDVVRERGVWIHSPRGDWHARPQCAAHPEEIGVCDLVLVALKTTANHVLPELLPPLTGPHTTVLTLQNGLGNEAALARVIPARQILGGLCFVCLNRVAPGVIQHTDHGQIVLGEYERPPEARTFALAERFQRAGVPCEVTPDLARAHWEKLVWNIPFNGLGVAGIAGFDAVIRGEYPPQSGTPTGRCLPTDTLLADPRWAGLVRELMEEVIAAASALGLPVAASHADKLLALTRTMGAYRASTLQDFEKGLPLELDSLFREPLRQGQAAGVAMPRLQAMCRVLEKLTS